MIKRNKLIKMNYLQYLYEEVQTPAVSLQKLQIPLPTLWGKFEETDCCGRLTGHSKILICWPS